jgi:hypothetical protein
MGSLLLLPGISTKFAPMRQWRWYKFEQAVLEETEIQARPYWQFRDLLSTGSVTTHESVLVREVLELVIIPDYPEAILRLDSAEVIAADYLVDKVTAQQLVEAEIALIPSESVILKSNGVIGKTADGTYRLAAYWPVEIWYDTVGFFNHTREEKMLTKDKYWYTTARFQIR